MGGGYPLLSMASMAAEGREPLRDWISLSVSFCFCTPDSALSPFLKFLEAALTDIEFSGASSTTFSSGGGDVASATPPAVVSYTPIQSIHRGGTAASCVTISSGGGGAATRCRSSCRVAPCSLHVMAARLQQTPPPALAGSAESADEAKELLADLLDETVRSGFQTLSSVPSHPLENEGAQFLQPIPGTFTEAKTSWPSTNAGMSKHEGEAGCHSITARQDSDGRKNSRDELATAEQDRDSKRQRSNGAPGEATLVMPGYCAVENFSAKPSGGEAAAP
ncbi:uncharacterized protein [Aegilops tauschii subsp. strangulata]|uniref:uncharacterized protein isoform X1 n=1 Tax=Aegilops tauschii subsp. strangulata TaxID=200361 RepID=UPI003CC87B69